MLKRLMCVSVLFLCIPNAYAQKEIRVGASYEQPLGELVWVYNPTIGYNVQIVERKGNDRVDGSIDIGYTSFKPKEDTLFFLFSEKEYGWAIYGSYDIYKFGLSVNVDFTQDTKLVPYAGIGLGMYIIKSEYVINGPGVDTDAWSFMLNAAIYPKVGLAYKFNNQVGVYLEGKYQIFAQTGSNDSDQVGYNPNLGQYNYYLSYGFGVSYRFE